MSAIWAMIQDTWRQSRQQVVLLIMAGLMLLVAIGVTVIAQPYQVEDEAGETTEYVGLLPAPEQPTLLAELWAVMYAQSLVVAEDEQLDPFSEEGQARLEELAEIATLEAETPPTQRGVEVLLSSTSNIVFTLGMLLFIAAASFYFPAMLESGAIDIVVAKPIPRWKIFLGKYFGGLALYTSIILTTYVLVIVGVGIRTGVWSFSLFYSFPLQFLSAATLFALLVVIGVYTRSAIFSLIIGYVYYLVVDSVLGAIASFSMFAGEGSWLDSVGNVLRATIPDFTRLKQASAISVINVPAVDWHLVMLALVWTGLGLGLAYWKFHRTDY